MKKQALRGLLAVMALSVMLLGTGCWETPEGGQVGVVRNGGLFDSKSIRQIIPQGSGNTWAGWASEAHWYPAANQQRVYSFDDDKDADAPPVVVFTKDGVRVRMTGTFYLNTAFGDPQADPVDAKCPKKVGGGTGDCLLRAFDTSFGTRSFGSNGKKPWEEGGFRPFLNAIMKPVIDSNLREVIAEFDCEELVSSCSLVQRGGEKASAKGNDNQSNVTRIQTAVNENLAEEIKNKLGQPYFQQIKFSLGPVVPSDKVQEAIDSAQAEFAKVSKAQARVESARRDKEANAIKQQGYNTCRSCARQDELKSLPDALQTYAPGGNFAVR